jgi:tyrosine-protein kinase Etk/Wzc
MSGAEVLEDKTNRESTAYLATVQQKADLIGLLIILAKRKRIIVWPTLVLGVATALFTLGMTNQFTAETKLLAPQPRDSMSSLMLGQMSSLGTLGNVRNLSASALGLTDPNGVYVSMLQSRTLADKLIDRFDLQSVYKKRGREETRITLARATEVASSKDGAILIRVSDSDRNRAAELANAYVDEFRKLADTLALTEAAQRRVYFEKELTKAKEQLLRAESALKVSQEQTGMLELDAQSKSIIQAMVNLKEQIGAKEAQIQSMSSFATAQNPDVIMAQHQLMALRTQLAKLQKGSLVGGGDILVPTSEIPRAGLEFTDRVREVKYYEQIFKVLATQFEAAKADEGRNAVVLQVLDVAVPPEKKSKPHRTMIVLFVTLLTFGFSVVAVFAVESLEQLQSDPERSGQIHLLKALLFSNRRR